MGTKPKPTPVDTPFDEYEAMRALRCECGGALSWGDRECERLAPPEDRYVLDRYVLTCGACSRTRPIEFLCDTRSEAYSGLAASAFGVALGLGPDGAAAVLAGLGAARPEPPAKASRTPKKRPARRTAKRKTPRARRSKSKGRRS